MFKYTKFYSGKEPELNEGDVFRITVPLDEEYSFDFAGSDLGVVERAGEEVPVRIKGAIDYATEHAANMIKDGMNATEYATNIRKDETNDLIYLQQIAKKYHISKKEWKVLQLIKEDETITQKQIQNATGISMGTIKRILPRLQEKGVLERSGSRRLGKWILKIKI